MPDAPKDSEIVRRILKGDVNAFELLLHRYKGHTLKIIRKRIPAQEVEDVAQEVFVKAYRSLPGFEPDSHFRKWLSAITIRTCYDYWRKAYTVRERPISSFTEKHQEWMEEVIASRQLGSTDGSTPREEAREVLTWALDRLSPEDRMVLELVHLEGMTGKEAADLLGWSHANVKVRAFRSRKKLRRLLSGLFKREEEK